MRGELNGLKSLILSENPSARYIHCFSHQLQLVAVAVAESNQFVGDFFDYLSKITNLVGASCKRKDEFRQDQHERLVEKSQLLQKKDQNILGAVSLIRSTKARLQALRDNGWDELLESVNKFCAQFGIGILNMEDRVQSRFRLSKDSTNGKYFRSSIYNQVIDRISMEMKSRFSESSTDLLTCMAYLDPRNSFSNFNGSKIVRLAELYPKEFSKFDIVELEEELKGWIYEMRENDSFSLLENIGDVARKMVKLGYNTTFPLVYRLIELVLVLPVATATVERAFSAMKIVKSDLRNKMGDDFLTDSLVCYIERDVFKSICNEVIMEHFQSMKTRKQGLLPLPPTEME